MKSLKSGLLLSLVPVLIVSLAACAAKPTNQADSLPLWENDAAHTASRVVVISDLHLGIDDSFSETTKNKAALVSFLGQLNSSEIDELVIDGDLFDQWFVPVSYTGPTELKAFFKKVAENNAEIVAALETLIKSGVTVTYVPGNHDLLLTDELLAELIPGIKQIRDVAGLGTYRTGARSEIVIEHGHRYNTFCAPDTLSNKEFTGAYPSILPPGYFFTRVAATSVAEGKSAPQLTLPEVAKPATDNIDQLGAYAYYQTWAGTIETFPIKAGFTEPVINLDVDGYSDSFALSDLLPTLQADGTISAALYANVQRRWDALQDANGVAVKLPYAEATARAQDPTFCDEQAVTQYFNVDPTVDIVVFGHTHVPVYNTFSQGYNREKTYVNSGTWIDKNLLGADMTFVVIESGKDTSAVRLMQYAADGTITDISQP
ncbi:metallophosphoesterase [Acetobacterium wieringae]|uniref:Metallophosphoesterase n=1 Tax=Acetobacterium wieringae TaxID=52694 RepID=A0A5D0WKC6_9FIRM|nr:metallophosphoesterase [Acetobacterium wieringae]TYC84775.1 metallophosphoesterase [Acetobacterium wieringae]